MERTTAADASFLYMENPVVHMHVTGVLLLDPSTVPGGFRFEAFREHVQSRLHRIPPFRRRLVRVPLGIDHPVWVDDPDFDIDEHLHHVTLDAPGTVDQLEHFVGEYASEPLDQNRPLWDMVVVDGLADGTIATVSKVHHVAVDGVSGTDLMAQIVDLEPDPPDAGPIPPFEPDKVPSTVEMTAAALGSRLADPLRGVRAFGRAAGSVGRILQTVTGSNRGPSMARPFDAPRTLFNHGLTARRSVSFAKTPLEDLKFVKSTFGTTVNDVFLAACTQSLREYLRRRGEEHDRPLVVSVPVSVHGRVADERATNQVSNMFVRLPIHVPEPVAQLRAIRADTRDAKAVHGAIGADMIGDVTELTPPAIFNLASRMYSRAGLADRLAPIHNLVISNVPGPPFPLYVAGARLVGVYPFGPLIEGSGLNITVLSNMGNMDIGVIACPDVAPDIDEISQGIVDGVEVLRLAAEEELAAAARPRRSSRPRIVRTSDTMPGGVAARAPEPTPGATPDPTPAVPAEPEEVLEKPPAAVVASPRTTPKPRGAKGSTAKRPSAKRATAKQQPTTKQSAKKKSTRQQPSAKKSRTTRSAKKGPPAGGSGGTEHT